jgi:hypothetical protein
MGRTAHEGTGVELLHDPLVVQLYLGGLGSAAAARAEREDLRGGSGKAGAPASDGAHSP